MRKLKALEDCSVSTLQRRLMETIKAEGKMSLTSPAQNAIRDVLDRKKCERCSFGTNSVGTWNGGQKLSW